MGESAAAVLVLNSLYQAVQVTGVRRAFRLFYAGRARALSDDFVAYDFDNWCDLPGRANDPVIRTPTRAIRIPSVIQLVSVKKARVHSSPSAGSPVGPSIVVAARISIQS